MWVFDATPLLYLAKVEELERLQHLEAPRVVPEPVYEEVVTTGIEQGYPDARRIEHHTETGHLEVASVHRSPLYDRLQQHDNLTNADAAVLAHADATDGIAVMDDTYGRDVAASEAITTRGTAYLILHLTKAGMIKPAAARRSIDAMLEAGWYCAPDVYAKLLRKLDDPAE